MTIDDLKQLNAAVTQSALDQRQLNNKVINEHMDAGDRALSAKAANTVLEVAKAIGENPTP